MTAPHLLHLLISPRQEENLFLSCSNTVILSFLSLAAKLSKRQNLVVGCLFLCFCQHFPFTSDDTEKLVPDRHVGQYRVVLQASSWNDEGLLLHVSGGPGFTHKPPGPRSSR